MSRELPLSSTPEAAPSLAKLPPFRLLEAFRGLAALWVVLIHAMVWKAAIVGPTIVESPFYAVVFLGQLGVTIFFVISGYCIATTAVSASSTSRPRAILGFAVARVRRIYPPYYFSVALWVASSAILGLMVSLGLLRAGSTNAFEFFRHGPLYYVATATLTQMPLGQELLQVVYWTLCYEVAFYAMVGLALVINARRPSATRLLYGLDVLTIALLIVRLVVGREIPFPLQLWYQFGLGVLVFHVSAAKGRSAPKVLFAIACLLALGLGVVGADASDFMHPSERQAACFSVGFSCFLLVVRGWDEAISGWTPVRWFAKVGLFSYSLYLTHLLVVSIISKLAARPGRGWAWETGLLAIQVVAALAFAWVFFRFFEAPFLRKPVRREPPVAVPAIPEPSIAG